MPRGFRPSSSLSNLHDVRRTVVCHDCLSYRYSSRHYTCGHTQLASVSIFGTCTSTRSHVTLPVNQIMELPSTSAEGLANGLAGDARSRFSPAEAFASMGLPSPYQDHPLGGSSAGPSQQGAGHGLQRTSTQSSVPTIWNTEGPTFEQGQPSTQHVSSPNATSSSETDHAQAAEPNLMVPDIRIACQNCKRSKAKCSGRPNRSTNLRGLQCDSCAENGDECVWTPSHRAPPGTKSRKSSKTTDNDEKALVQILSACNACAKRKQRCSGDRPTCHYCHEKGFEECVYEVSEGMTRSEDLKEKLVRFKSCPFRGLDARSFYQDYFHIRGYPTSKPESVFMAFSEAAVD